jgi:hypothetical protein
MKQVHLAILAAFVLALFGTPAWALSDGKMISGVNPDGSYVYKTDGCPEIITPEQGKTTVVIVPIVTPASTSNRSTGTTAPSLTKNEARSIAANEAAEGDRQTVKSIKNWAKPKFEHLENGLQAANETASAINTQVIGIKKEIESIKTDLTTLSENDQALDQNLKKIGKKVNDYGLLIWLAVLLGANGVILGIINWRRGYLRHEPDDEVLEVLPPAARRDPAPADAAEHAEETPEELEARLRREAGLPPA